ncbi:MAG TPA: hypothetical protein PLI84_10410 [Ornithinibacter sp.]|nr:hypothetical protein [Ornithinibacter sp.]HPV90730.1 hypothetical protein [Ornithinibacter sp.]HQA13297.1 hypothetical protein [Ornithinibacter sp.]
MSDDRRWTYADVAAHLGIEQATARSYKHRGYLPPPDGVLGSTPWWRPETITSWTRPGRGARTDIVPLVDRPDARG